MKRIYAPWRSGYLRGKKQDACLFCLLANEKVGNEHWIVYKGDHWYVIINTYPYSSGHLMVVCNRHIEKITDLEVDEGKELILLLSMSERALRKGYSPDGINIGANLGRSAGAGIEGHLHVHIVPRWHGDTNFFTTIGETRLISEDLRETYERIAGNFS